MHREQVCYKCTCCKCQHKWITKDYELPRVCAKCKSVKWDDDQPEDYPKPQPVSPSIAPESVAPVITGEWVEDPKFGGMNAKMAAILSLSQSAKPAPALTELPSEEIWKFTKDPVQYADNGNCYRQQYDTVNPKRRRTVQVDPDTYLPLDN